MSGHTTTRSTRPFASVYQREAAELLHALESGGGSLEDVDRTLTDGVAHALELEAQVRRLQRETPTPVVEQRLHGARRRLEEIADLVGRLRIHRNAMAAAGLRP